jgi:hypothetical protein
MQGIEIPIGAPLGQLDKDLKGAENKLKGFTSSAETNLKGFSSTAGSAFKTAGLAFVGAFSVGAFVSFGKEVLAVTAEFEKFGAVLGNTLGSNALAKLKLKEIEQFAAKTPFSVQELTNSFVKLANQGFKPTGDEMRKLGDLAASTGKSFDQLAEAILDASTGEFERLKEFGVRAQDAGDKVIFTFKGVQTTVDKSSEAIRNYVTSLGDAEGVSGSMAVISETLTGKISNLGDSWDQMLVSIGSNTSGVFSSVIDIISKGINAITRFNKELEIQSKFKIGGGFLKRLTTSTEFDSEETFNTKKAVDSIIALDDELTKLVSGVISGAKSVNDFGTAISKIKAEGDKKIKQTSILGPEAVAGIKDTYQNAIKALQDGRKQFQAELSKPAAASFGKAPKAKVSKDQKAELDYEKRLLEIKKEGAAFAGNLELLKISNKVTQGIEKEAQAQKDFNDGLEKATIIGEQFNTEIFQKKLKKVNQALIEFNAAANDIIQNSIINTFNNLGTAIGEALATGGNVLKAIGNTILQGLAGFLSEMGSLLIKYGTLAVLKGKLDIAILTGGPIAIGAGLAAIAAGIALKAAGGAIGSLASKGSGGGGGSSRGAASVPVPQGSASISTSAAGSAQDFGSGAVVFEISGANLIGVLNRAGAKLTRYGP